MSSVFVPTEVPISTIVEKGFSPRNFAEVGIPRASLKPLRDFLEVDTPFIKGIEPGGSSYVARSETGFLRNSCINLASVTPDLDRLVHINPNLGYENMLASGDVLLCKDANIGETALYLTEKDRSICFSSGIVKLNFLNENERYFALAAMRDAYFTDQLYALTPRGSTIRHAGEKFLDCKLPSLRTDETWLLSAFKSLILNAAHAELECVNKLRAGTEIINLELMIKAISYSHPSIQTLCDATRMDAGFYSELVQSLDENLRTYSHGHQSLGEAGFTIRRGPNLAKRDLGRSIITDEYRAGYDVLIYPTDISSSGFLLRSNFIGARGSIWHLGIGDILFSAEGTVGRVFAVCDDTMHFTTNFHGMIVSAKPGTPVQESAFLGMYLHFLRDMGWFSKVSVGGQGGSFASAYWGLVRLPKFPAEIKRTLSGLYHVPDAMLDPFQFDISKLKSAGVFELSQLRLQCAALSKMLMQDLKNDVVRPQTEYHHIFDERDSKSGKDDHGSQGAAA